jgi:UDP-GlcNAc:undecaprenyl-phosphate GlcNAc-1-phosphate transferase
MLFFSFVGSLAVSMALIPALAASAGRLHILDFPGERKLHGTPIARVGGIAFAVGALAATLLWGPKDAVVLSSLAGGLVLLVFGVWDDRAGLSYRMKFLGQIIAAAIVVWCGEVRLTSLPLLSDSLPEWISIPVTVVALVGVTNAINLADGLDGLAGGLSLLSLGAIGYLAFLSGDLTVGLMVVSMLGGLLGFLRFNTHPARVFMGDAGSQFLGFYLGIAALLVTDAARGPYGSSLALLLLGLPVLDTIAVMSQRLAEGRSPFQADQNHVHHRLLAVGFRHSEAVVLIYTVQAAMVTLACTLRWQSDAVVLVVFGCFASLVWTFFILAGSERLHISRTADLDRLGAAVLQRLRASRWGTDAPVRFLAASVPLFLALSIFLPRVVPPDVGYSAAGLFLVLLAALAAFPQRGSFLVRCAAYVGTTFALYLAEQAPVRASWPLSEALNVFFALTAVLVVLTIRFSREQRFQTTPLDYLMVILALVIPALPEIRIGEIEVGRLTAKLIVLFFSYEVLLDAVPKMRARLGALSLWVLLALGLRSWL